MTAPPGLCVGEGSADWGEVVKQPMQPTGNDHLNLFSMWYKA